MRVAEGVGFDAAPITTSRGFVMMPELRNNTRVILDDRSRARSLWDRLAPWVPARRTHFQAAGVNERFRFYRYTSSQYFRWHRDGAFIRDDDGRSLLTAMVYLNEGFEGGSTDFDTTIDTFSVRPERGMALIFDHPLRHQGAPIARGVKYVLRTDVMYRRAVPHDA